jgi:hypothetical protein
MDQSFQVFSYFMSKSVCPKIIYAFLLYHHILVVSHPGYAWSPLQIQEAFLCVVLFSTKMRHLNVDFFFQKLRNRRNRRNPR